MRRVVTAVQNQGHGVLREQAQNTIQQPVTEIKRTGKTNTRRGERMGEEREEETKSGRKNLMRQRECGRKRERDQCFKWEGGVGGLVMSESFERGECQWE